MYSIYTVGLSRLSPCTYRKKCVFAARYKLTYSVGVSHGFYIVNKYSTCSWVFSLSPSLPLPPSPLPPLSLSFPPFCHYSLSPSSINGDHVPDIFAIACDKESRTPTFFVSHDSGTSFRFTQQPLTSYPVPDLSDLISSYFVDLDSDCLPELVLYRESNRVIEVWKSGKSGMEFKFNQSLHSSLNSMHWGMPTFADMGEYVEYMYMYMNVHVYTHNIMYA